jgi:hypothetical protein
VPVTFQSNHWYQIALSYSPTNVALYTNGQLLATAAAPQVTTSDWQWYGKGNNIFT